VFLNLFHFIAHFFRKFKKNYPLHKSVGQGRNQGGLRGLKAPPLSQVKFEKKIKSFNFYQISYMQLDQNVTATLSYPPSYLILSHSSS